MAGIQHNAVPAEKEEAPQAPDFPVNEEYTMTNEVRDQLMTHLIYLGYTVHARQLVVKYFTHREAAMEDMVAHAGKMKMNLPELEGHPAIVSQVRRYLELANLDERFAGLFTSICSGGYNANMVDRMKVSNATMVARKKCIRYQGFDKGTLLKVLANAYVNNKTVPLRNFVLVLQEPGHKDKQWQYSNKESFDKDMCFLVKIFLCDDHLLRKIKDRSRVDYVDLLNMLINKYRILVKNPADQRSGRGMGGARRREPLTKTTVTLPRIAMLFPMVSAYLTQHNVGRILARHAAIEGFPLALHSPLFASMIPDNLLDEAGVQIKMNVQVFLIDVLVDRVIHREQQDYTDIRTLYEFFKAARNSSVMKTNDKRVWGVKLGYLIPQINAAQGWADLAANLYNPADEAHRVYLLPIIATRREACEQAIMTLLPGVETRAVINELNQI